jgi:polyisoprenoid-binding protein YceI
MTTANSQAPVPAGPSSGPAGPSSWELDPAATTAAFSHKTFWGLATVRGTFRQVAGSGEILADGTGRGRLEIAAASLDTKNRQRDNHLRSADFFNAAEHPQVIIDIASATRQNSDSVQLTGTLTVAGTARPLTATARVSEVTGQAVTLTAEADIDRADFGMTWNRGGMLKAPARVTIAAKFVRAAS